MIKKIVFDMDNTLIDEFGSTLRPGIAGFLEQLISMNCEMYLWTNSSRNRAKEILAHHELSHYFTKFIFREDYDPDNKGVRKDIRKVGGEMLIDDDPDETRFTEKLGLKSYLVKSYRKNMKTDSNEYKEILKVIKGDESFLKRIFKI